MPANFEQGGLTRSKAALRPSARKSTIAATSKNSLRGCHARTAASFHLACRQNRGVPHAHLPRDGRPRLSFSPLRGLHQPTVLGNETHHGSTHDIGRAVANRPRYTLRRYLLSVS